MGIGADAATAAAAAAGTGIVKERGGRYTGIARNIERTDRRSATHWSTAHMPAHAPPGMLARRVRPDCEKHKLLLRRRVLRPAQVTHEP